MLHFSYLMTSWEFISMFLFLFYFLHVIITVAGAPSSFLFISLPSVPWTIITAVTLFPFWPSVPFLSSMFSLSFVIFVVIITVPWFSFFFNSGLGKILILVASFFLSFLWTPIFFITVVIIKYQIIASIKESRKNKLPRKSTHPFGHNLWVYSLSPWALFQGNTVYLKINLNLVCKQS